MSEATKWTTTPPTKEGYWWGCIEGEIVLVSTYIYTAGGRRLAEILTGDRHGDAVRLNEVTAWIPIEEPELPKEQQP